MPFVSVADGDFYTAADDIEDASSQHPGYQLDYDYYIGRYRVRNQQEYSEFLREAGQPIVMARGELSHPAINVSWGLAQEFVAYHLMRNGKRPHAVYPTDRGNQ